jgi:hypothetical protein
MTHALSARRPSGGAIAVFRLVSGIVLAAAAGGPLAAEAGAQTFTLPARFDFRPSGVPTATGYLFVEPTDLYGSTGNYGFTQAPVNARYGTSPAHDVVDREDDDRDVLRGCIDVANGTEFVCHVSPNQLVRARVVLSSVPFYWKLPLPIYDDAPTSVFDLEVAASDGTAMRVVASDIDLRTPYVKAKPTSLLGSYRKVWLTAKADGAGKLRFRFNSASGAPSPVAAIEIYPFVPAPLKYKRQGATWLTPTAGGTLAGLAEFHARDYAGAHAKFLALADPLTRADALMWLAGWLTPVADGYAGALSDAKAALAVASLAANPRAIEMRDRLADYERAELHFSLRNYSFSHAMPPQGHGFFNPAWPGSIFAFYPGTQSNGIRHFYLAENLFYQVSGTASLAATIAWNGGTHPDSRHEVFPLSFKALDRVARIYYSMNSTHSYKTGSTANPDALAGIELYENLWKSFDQGGFRTNEFDGCSELDLCCWVASSASHDHGSNGGLVEQWAGADVSSAYLDPQQAWWKPLLLATPAPAGAPNWADFQRRYLHSYRSAIDWWIGQRAVGGEFGGGPGDDPELVALLHAPLAAIEQPGDALRRGVLFDSADRVLEGGFVEDGYYSNALVDVEHSAEFTTYPIRVALALAPGDPHYLDASLAVGKHLSYPGNPAKSWAAPGVGGWFFHSLYFNTQGPPTFGDPNFADKFVDVPFNGRALLPAFQFLRHVNSPPLLETVLAWGRAWRNKALTVDSKRPLGLVPASVGGLGTVDGVDGSWWRAMQGPSLYDFPGAISSLPYLYDGAFGLGHDVDASQNYLWLVPMVEMLKGVTALQAKLDAGQPPSDINIVGSKNWALSQLRTTQAFVELAARMLAPIAADASLRTIDDPHVPGNAPYVDDEFITAYTSYLEKNAYGYSAYLAQPHGGADPLNGVYVRKGKSLLIAALSRGEGWLRNYFPLATSLVAFTDRAYLYHGASHRTLTGMLTGDPLDSAVPQPIVTWRAPETATQPLDVAILVNDLAVKEGTTNARLRVLLYNFEPVARSIEFRLWHRLPIGRYHLRTGPAHADTDYFTSTPAATTLDFDHSGAGATISLPPQTTYLLELEWFAPLTPPTGFDLAISRRQIAAKVDGSGMLRFTGTVFSTGNAGTPAATARLFAGLLDPTGKPVPLDSLGSTEIELPLTKNHPALAGVSAFALARADVELALPFTPAVAGILASGLRLQLRFEVSNGNDLHPGNDTAVRDFAWPDFF